MWLDEDFRSLVDRYHEQVLPLGVIPGYGDGSGWAYDATGLIWLFESASTHLRDGRYKWTAHRIFAYNQTRARHAPPRHDSWKHTLFFLAHAYLASDDAIRPTHPQRARSVLLTRKQMLRREEKDRGDPPQFGDLTARSIPSKIVFRSGPSENDMTLFVNLLSGYRHGHTNLGALVSLTDRGSVLLSETAFPYANFSLAPEAESIPFLRRYWGGETAEEDQSVQVTRFQDDENLTTAWFRWSGSQGWNVEQERRIFFVKNRFVWLRDRFTFHSPMYAAAGPLFHFADLHPMRGAHWFNAYYQTPIRNVWRYENPEGYCLIYFVPRPDERAEQVAIDPAFLPPANCERRVADPLPAACRAPPAYYAYQRWTGEAGAGTTKWFDTLLIPSSTPVDPSADAHGTIVDTRVHTEGAVSIEILLDGERWLLLDNPAGEALTRPFIRSDAAFVVAALRQGAEPYLNVHGATFVEVDAVHRSWPSPTSEESGAITSARTASRSD
jgi:hypothetical protein